MTRLQTIAAAVAAIAFCVVVGLVFSDGHAERIPAAGIGR